MKDETKCLHAGYHSRYIPGYCAKQACQEAKLFREVRIAASSEDRNFTYIPDCSNLNIAPDSDYLYMCENNTIYGTKFHAKPDSKGKILGNDISSSFLSEPMNILDYDMLFGGIQKKSRPGWSCDCHYPKGFDF